MSRQALTALEKQLMLQALEMGSAAKFATTDGDTNISLLDATRNLTSALAGFYYSFSVQINSTDSCKLLTQLVMGT